MNHDLGAYTLQIAILMGTGYRFEIKLTMLWVHWFLSLDPYRHLKMVGWGSNGKRWEEMGRDGKRSNSGLGQALKCPTLSILRPLITDIWGFEPLGPPEWRQNTSSCGPCSMLVEAHCGNSEESLGMNINSNCIWCSDNYECMTLWHGNCISVHLGFMCT